MNANELRYVVGAVNEDQPAQMRFYGRIDEDSTRAFNDEFLWLQDCVKPSKIVISINSEGGSVLYGMGTFSIIQQCPIEVETIIDGVAASMASVIWAAGTRSYMRDYSILMIHNPFMSKDDADGADPDTQQTVNAFQKQIECIYNKRFGLTKAQVREIMDGKEGCDGTWFDAKSAVEAGIIPAENVIKTSKQVRDKVKNKIDGVVEAHAVQEIMASVTAELGGIKPQVETSSIHNQKQVEIFNQTEMEKEQNFAFGSVCAQLGLDKTSEVSAVINRITALMNAENKVKEVQASLDALQIQKAGVDQELANVKNELSAAQSELKNYKDAEKAKRDAEIEAFVELAVNDGKIDKDSKAKWVEMAQTNFEMVQSTLNSIAKRDKISEKIANDPANVDAAKDGLTEAERRMAENVQAAVGKDFQFKTLD